jgi:hypothetical protein
MVFIYVLKLTNHKYYVGRTENLEFRLDTHFNNNGSKWTTKYKPIEIIEIFKNCDVYDEDKYTIKYMNKYGIDNVRGGTFTQIILTEEQKKFINHMINGANDNCFICGEPGHFVSNCPNKNKKANQTLKTNYWENNSYTKVFINGINILSNLFFSNRNETQYNSKNENNNTEWCIVSKPKSKTEDSKCYRCDRAGHFANKCYAKYHMKGYIIKDKNNKTQDKNNKTEDKNNKTEDKNNKTEDKNNTPDNIVKNIQTKGVCLID